jgi:hypothetical protein
MLPKGVPNSTHFNPICFAQSPPLLTYIGGPKGKAFLQIYVESFILGSLHNFSFSLQGVNQIGKLGKKKIGLVRHAQLVNMKHNKTM